MPNRLNSDKIISFPKVYKLLDNIEYRVINNPEDMENVFRLRYTAYKYRNAIRNIDDKKCSDDLDKSENGRIFGVYYNGRLISTIRVHYLNLKNAIGPSTLVYNDILWGKLHQGRTFVDSSRFANDPNFEFGGNLVHLLTMRIPILACQYFKADYSLSLVRASHGSFYSRYFGSEKWGGGRIYPGLKFSVDLYSGEVDLVCNKVLRRYPFMNSLRMEQDILFDESIGQRCCFTALSTARIASQDTRHGLENIAA